MHMLQEEMEISIIPVDKKWWQFWKWKKKLKRGKHYIVENGVIKFTKPYSGEKYKCIVNYFYQG